MDFVDRQSSPVYEEKSCEETTVFINENGSVSKRRRRKSLGRRVSFAEAPPSLHIFPRDDEYETPTRATNGVGSPHQVGERRSPRLAAKVVDGDKENRVLIASAHSLRRKGANKPRSVRGGGSPALKPHNWLDDRNLQSQAGSEEGNTGPVDLRHLSFDQKESEVDDENLTLDSTTFALKFSVLRDRSDEVLVHLDENSSPLGTVEAFPNEDVLEKDMSFTIIRPFSGRKSVTDSHAGSRDMNSDTSDMITVHSQPRQRMPHILSGDNNSDNDDSMILGDLSVHGTGQFSLPGSKNDNSPSVVYSHNVKSSPVPVSHSVDGRAQVEERWGKDIGEDEINISTGSEEDVDAARSMDMSATPPSVRSTTGHEDHREEEDEEMMDDDRRLSFTIKRAKYERDVSTVDGKDSGDVNSSHKIGYIAVDKWWTAQDNNPSPVPVDGTQDDDTSPALESVTAQVPRFSDLIAVDLNSVNSTPIRPVNRSMWMTPPSSMVAARAYVNPEKETGDSGYLTSPTDISMEIVEPTVHSLSASPIGAVEESPKISDSEVPDIFAPWERVDDKPIVKEKSALSISLTRTNLDPKQSSLTSQEKESVAFLSGPEQKVRSQSQYLESQEKGRHDNTVYTEEIGEGGGDSINVATMSVEEFFQHTEVRFSPGLQSPGVLFRDPSLAATHQVRTLSECFNFLCLTQPKLVVLRNSCGDLEDEIDRKATAVEELEYRLSSINPAILSFFQNAPEWKKERIKKQLEINQSKYRLLAEMNRLHFQKTVETAYQSRFLEMKDTIKHYIQYVREQRNIFDETCCQPLVCLQAKISRETNFECTTLFQPKLSKVEVNLRNKADIERIEYLKERLKDAESSEDLKLAKLRPRKQAAEDTLRGLKQSLERTKNKLSDLRSQAADKVCFGKKYPQREVVARSPHLYVRNMRDEVYLLDMLQDGFQVRTFQENHDLVVELGYRSIVKRRYVVSKVGVAVKVLASSWALDTAKIEEMFPGVNAPVMFSLALTTTKYSSISATTAFGPLSALETVRFMLPSLKTVGMPEPSNLRASMQFTRILVGNLTEFMTEVGKCQLVVNASSDGGVLCEPRFRNAPDDGQLQLELTFIDCISSIKFFVTLDMSCLPLTGYPLGDLKVTLKVDYCAPPSRDHFKAETLEHALSLVKPGYQRLVRTYAAVGAFLASLRRGV